MASSKNLFLYRHSANIYPLQAKSLSLSEYMDCAVYEGALRCDM